MSGAMPSGRVHNLINIAAYSVLASGVLLGVHLGKLVITPAQAASFSAAYAVGTFMLSPDLDLSEGQVNSKRNWGALGVMWVPYGMIFSHRGVSHTWIVGPLTRLVYTALILLVLLGLLTFIYPPLHVGELLPRPLSFKWLLPALLGYYVSQWLHLIADGVRPDHGLRHAQRGRRKGQAKSKWPAKRRK